MTPQETLEYNKRCAKFLGYKCSVNEQYELPNMMTFPPKENSNLCHTAKVCCVEDMIFHSDWNWIMEVVGAICFYYKDKEVPQIHLFNMPIFTPKKAVVEAINQFLIWYENGKTS